MNQRLFLSIVSLLIITGIVVHPLISNHGYAQVTQKKVFRLDIFLTLPMGKQ
jgi:hypothetical protein